MKKYDAIIIGSGQAGNPLAKHLAKAGWKTAIIEKRLVGGTCINDGCTPTKTMIGSSRMAYLANRSSDFGVEVDDYSINFNKVTDRKNKVVESFRSASEKGLEETENVDLIFGEAEFAGHKTLQINLKDGGTEEITAEHVFINTGTQTTIPPVPGLDNIDYLTSTTILDLQDIPDHLLIIGGSYIALEFGQMFCRFGSKITILETAPEFLSREDRDVADEMKKILEDEGIQIHISAKAGKFEKQENESIKAFFTTGEDKKQLTCSHVLIAAGRNPQTKSLKPEKTGVMLDDKGYIVVNDKLETNVPGIYALGDVKGGPAFTHISYNDFIIVSQNLLDKGNFSTHNRLVPYCMFTDPQLGRVGITETEANKQGLSYKIAKLPMEKVARAIETDETRGFMKAIVDTENKKILGAAIIGTEGGEIVSALQIAMMGGLTYEQIRYGVFAHPTFTESLNNLFMKITD